MYTKDVDITVAKPEISLVGGLEQTVEITEDNPNPVVTFKANTSNTRDTVVYTFPSLTVGKLKMSTNPVNMGSVDIFLFVTICAILLHP